MQTKYFSNKTIIMSGASEGIGAASVKRFYDQGANLVLIARRADVLTQFASSFEDQTRIKTYAMDVLDYSKFSEVLKETKAQFGSIDILINNAAAHFRGNLATVLPEQIEAMVSVNLTAPIVLTRLVLPYFEEQKNGLIINIASLAGRTPVDNAAIYSGTKFGLRTFSKAFNCEYEGTDKNIQCCVISPGPILTNFVLSDLDNVADLVFSQPISTPEDIAEMIDQTAKDHKFERVSGGFFTAILTNMGYLFPLFKKELTPLMQAKGRRVKEKLRQKRDAKTRKN